MTIQSVAISIQSDTLGDLHFEPICQKEFQSAPIALRRKDILTFLETPEEQRQIVFLDFFRHGTSAPALPDSEETRGMKDTQLRLKNERRSYS